MLRDSTDEEVADPCTSSRNHILLSSDGTFVPSPSVRFQSIGTSTTASMLLLYESATTDSEALLAKLRPYVNDIED